MRLGWPLSNVWQAVQTLVSFLPASALADASNGPIGSGPAGAAAAYAVNQLNPVVGSLRVVNELTPFPVLGVVSAAFPTQEGREHRAEVWRFSAATAVFIAAFAVVLAVDLIEEPRTEQGVHAVAKS